MQVPQLRGRSSPFEDVILSVFQLSNLLSASGDGLVADLGLTSARWQVLGAIGVGPSRPVAWLARDLGVSRQNVQRIVNDLQRDGLVSLEPNPHHKRAQLVEITSTGRDALDSATRRAKPWAEHAAAGIDPDDIETTQRVLHAIGDAILIYDKRSSQEENE
ncbi:MarR family transcriptional regulator [Subtercola sp. Z020]|uniref:MarR family winged helix-turn-helix transcriptional regulator n=1 Tax=Subtercola sp. Z020 TaxID=2080582 RepID=UPI000CE86985|nr:MarR family winged helix-turn-helix transcriptional regulator [Subtercola sp. Z020]PPF85664.1 MarR family transcriptional regulator [Subtercola sp. Z020]